jgi:hypothetical protein
VTAQHQGAAKLALVLLFNGVVMQIAASLDRIRLRRSFSP